MVETLSGSWEKRSSPLLTLRTPNLPGTQRVGSPSRKQKKETQEDGHPSNVGGQHGEVLSRPRR